MGRIYHFHGGPEPLRWSWSLYGILGKPQGAARIESALAKDFPLRDTAALEEVHAALNRAVELLDSRWYTQADCTSPCWGLSRDERKGLCLVTPKRHRARAIPCRYLIRSQLRRNEIEAIVAIVRSERSRHISPCIAADRDWITKKN
jgi:hypothetical protein